jgi:hypothetical protein
MGFWVVDLFGDIFNSGDAVDYGDFSNSSTGPEDVVSVVPTPDGHGYWMVGADGGIFGFGDATYLGSLPGLGVVVGNIVGAVPTAAPPA